MESFLNRLYGFDATKKEHRKNIRYPVSLSGQCHYRSGEQPLDCRIVDICDQGVGFELDSCIDVQFGQNVLLSIFPPDSRKQVDAIVRLQWAKISSEGPLKQRIGSSLIFMDPIEKAQLLQYAHTMSLVGVDKNSYALRGMAIKHPKFK